MSISLKLFDYNVIHEKNILAEENKDANEFVIRAFGINNEGKSYCLYIKNFNPFFYIRVNKSFKKSNKEGLIDFCLNK